MKLESFHLLLFENPLFELLVESISEHFEREEFVHLLTLPFVTKYWRDETRQDKKFLKTVNDKKKEIHLTRNGSVSSLTSLLAHHIWQNVGIRSDKVKSIPPTTTRQTPIKWLVSRFALYAKAWRSTMITWESVDGDDDDDKSTFIFLRGRIKPISRRKRPDRTKIEPNQRIIFHQRLEKRGRDVNKFLKKEKEMCLLRFVFFRR